MNRLLLAFVLLATLPACQELLSALEVGQDPEVVAAREELEVALNDLAGQEATIQEQWAQILDLQAKLRDEGLNAETAQAVTNELADAMGRYSEVSDAVLATREKIEALGDEIDQAAGEGDVPWWLALLGTLVGGALPTLNGIPLLGPLLSGRGTAKALERAGLRNETGRAVKRTSAPPPTP